MGVAFGYTQLGFTRALLRGLNKLEANPAALAADLDATWELLAEPIQTVMRRYGIEKAVRAAERPDQWHRAASPSHGGLYPEPGDSGRRKTRLLALSPATYLGKAAELAKRI